MSTTALVITGGGSVRRALPPGVTGALVIAADGGVVEAHRLGLHVDVLVGDLDSASPDDVATVESGGGAVERHPTDKDATDLELALEHALGAGAGRVVVAGGDGGRLDHLFGNLTLLASPRWAPITIDAVIGAALIHVVRDEREMRGELGELVSVFAVGGRAGGVTTQGLRWALHDAELEAGSSLGISNEFAAPDASVRVRTGAIVAIRPGGAA